MLLMLISASIVVFAKSIVLLTVLSSSNILSFGIKNSGKYPLFFYFLKYEATLESD